MALAKVYDSEDTLMVPLDLDGTEGLARALYESAAVLETVSPLLLGDNADALRNLADAVTDARVAAGLNADPGHLDK